MKFLLALTILLASLVLALTEPDTDRDVELLRDNLVVRDKREPGVKKVGGKKKSGNIKGGKSEKNTGRKVAKGGKRRNLNKKNDKKKNRKKNKKKRKKNKGGQGLKKKRRQMKTCSDSATVSSSCLEDAVYVLKYLKMQVRSFNRKFSRIKNFNKTMGNKLGKKGVFEETAKYLLMALGGDISSAACGETGDSENKTLAVETYKNLTNCSAAIHDVCSMPKTTLSDENITSFDNCQAKFTKISSDADDCRINSTYADNGPAACTCWSNVRKGIDENKGSCNNVATNTAVKNSKNTCVETFTACRKAEDQAVALVYECGSGEVANSTKSTS